MNNCNTFSLIPSVQFSNMQNLTIERVQIALFNLSTDILSNTWKKTYWKNRETRFYFWI